MMLSRRPEKSGDGLMSPSASAVRPANVSRNGASHTGFFVALGVLWNQSTSWHAVRANASHMSAMNMYVATFAV